MSACSSSNITVLHSMVFYSSINWFGWYFSTKPNGIHIISCVSYLSSYYIDKKRIRIATINYIFRRRLEPLFEEDTESSSNSDENDERRDFSSSEQVGFSEQCRLQSFPWISHNGSSFVVYLTLLRFWYSVENPPRSNTKTDAKENCS